MMQALDNQDSASWPGANQKIQIDTEEKANVDQGLERMRVAGFPTEIGNPCD